MMSNEAFVNALSNKYYNFDSSYLVLFCLRLNTEVEVYLNKLKRVGNLLGTALMHSHQISLNET